MPHTAKKPPVLLRWLSFERRHIMAIWLRDKAASLAEWICPEMVEQEAE
jgi:hypothetical protein